MGNALTGSKKAAKVMKISGEMLKCKTPTRAGEVVLDYPGHVLLESTEVKQFGIRARPLEPEHELKPKKLYFLIEFPNHENLEKAAPRRAEYAMQTSAKDRLERLKLSRRAVSDLSSMVSNPRSIMFKEPVATSSRMMHSGRLGESCRVKMKLPRAEVGKLMEQSQDKAEAAKKILDLCLTKYNATDNLTSDQIQQMQWNSNEKSVRLLPMNDGEIQQEIHETWY